MLERGEGEGVGCECEFFCVVEAEEEIGDGGCGVIDDFDGLLCLPAELDHLGLDGDDFRAHASVKLKNDYYIPFKSFTHPGGPVFASTLEVGVGWVGDGYNLI